MHDNRARPWATRLWLGIITLLIVGMAVIAFLTWCLIESRKQCEYYATVCREQPTSLKLKRLGAKPFYDMDTGSVDGVLFGPNTNVEEAIGLLGSLSDLRDLTFDGGNTTDRHVSRLVEIACDNKIQIQMLTFCESGITSVGLSDLKKLPELWMLDLADTEITDAGLKQVAALNGLQDLVLAFTPITDEGLAIVANIEGLQWLSLRGTNITDQGLAYLTRLRHLESLDISYTNVTDSGVVHLKQLKSLESLRFSYTRISDAGVAELQTALPNWETE